MRATILLAVLAATATAGCKLVKNPDPAELAAAQAEAAKGGGAGAAEMWSAEVVPHVEGAAVDIATLRPAIAAGLGAAGAAHGHRSRAEGAPWNFPVRLTGKVVEARTDTRAATAGVDTDGDGAADVTVQLGPVIRGTTLRDVLPFVDFTAYRDQIAFAELARALNDQAYADALEALPRDALVGKPVTVVGAFTLKAPGDPILVTPVSVEVGA